MSQTTQIKLLKLSMQVVGVIFIVGIYALMVLWPSGWRWHTGHSHYPAMILGVYATLGLFLLLASRNPLAHLSLTMGFNMRIPKRESGSSTWR